jgi:hypothetical protein
LNDISLGRSQSSHVLNDPNDLKLNFEGLTLGPKLQINERNEMNQINEMNEINELNETNQRNQTNRRNPKNQMNRIIVKSQGQTPISIHQTNQTNGINEIDETDKTDENMTSEDGPHNP